MLMTIATYSLHFPKAPRVPVESWSHVSGATQNGRTQAFAQRQLR
jgi:hypothetical protein